MSQEENLATDIVWSIDDIAATINRTPRQTKHLLTKGQIPGKKVGHLWTARKSELNQFFQSESIRAENLR
ncbi:DNA-binding protein [Devosia sp. MC532]|uniref:DNA-binding protein n=1 Tax=Devosia sp. MC532 TaxID=2799788 RepID=UPI0018F75D35|nr:DNA-binding protein [Devosia sp. MC532]MBJ7578430.1 DNA-binding protein [Devosia sp. MC532]